MWHHRKACGDATKFLFDKLYVYIRSSFATGNQKETLGSDTMKYPIANRFMFTCH